MESTTVSGLTNQRVVLTTYFDTVPDAAHFRVEQAPLPAGGEGQALCRTLYVSLDPYLRVAMLPPNSRVPSGGTRLPLGAVVPGRGVSQVIESRIPGLAVGTIVRSVTGWQTYSSVDTDGYDAVPSSVPPSAALGVLGMPGLTAWAALRFIGRPNPGETVVVSAASGAVGSLVVQLARRWGCRAVGIAGSADKCRWVKEEVGADQVVSHKSATFQKDLAAACPDGIDVYFDNVGGDVLVATLALLRRFARIIVCGRIAHLNEHETNGTSGDRLATLLGTVLTRAVTVQGFEVSQFAPQRAEFERDLTPLVASGEIRYREDILDGLERIPTEYRRLFDGSNFGKLLAKVTPED